MSGDGMQLGVVHVHSDYSHDGLDSLEVLRDFARARGLRFVALTDHAEDLTHERYAEMTGRCRALSGPDVTLIPGLEFRFAGMAGFHLLALGLTRWIEPATPADFVRQTRGAAGLTILAHPVLSRYVLPDVVARGIDAIEIWNAAYNTRYLPDPRAMRMVQRLRRDRPEVVATVGLDQHDARNDRETRIAIAAGATDPLAEIRAGRFVNIGRTMRLDPHAGMGALPLALLQAARWGYDRAERLQDRIGRRLARRRDAR